MKSILICCYPKTGSTWLRWQLAHVCWPNTPPEEFDFDFVNFRIPTIESKEEMAGYRNISFPAEYHYPSIFKSHNNPNTEYPGKFILLVRPPVDVMFSLFHYEKKFNHLTFSYGYFLSEQFYGQGYLDWLINFYDFLNQKNQKEKCLMVRYSNLQYEETLKKIVEFIGIKTQNSIIENAIRKSSFSEMRKIEDEKGLGIYSNRHPGKFIRNGLANENKLNGLSRSIVDRLEKITFNYSIIISKIEKLCLQ